MDVATSDFLRTRAPVGRENEKVGRAHVAIGASDALLCLLLADKSERKQPAASACIKAGERTRTVNIQLGRLTLYQLSYARLGRDDSLPTRFVHLRDRGRSFAVGLISTRQPLSCQVVT